MKKIIIIILVVTAIGAGVYFFIYRGEERIPPGTEVLFPIAPSTQESPPIPTTDKVVIPTPNGNIIINNFFKTANKISPTGGATLKKENNYIIAYIRFDNSFAIALMKKPLQQARQDAENALLAILGINKDEACKLTLTLGVPISVDRNAAVKNYGLSFCPNGKSL